MTALIRPETPAETMTREQACDALDDLRDALTHTAACEAELPRPARSCDACEQDHLISRVIRDLHDGYPLDEANDGAVRIARSLPYGIGCKVMDAAAAARD